ncbi:MAG: hypothetical protein CSA07_01030 [Bacteroidia bacterium]|nr:MAG: hypothetical protein CSA07_01030 [Bacteroidia bacterium]
MERGFLNLGLGFLLSLLVLLGLSACGGRVATPLGPKPQTEANLAIEWVWVEGGTFRMGSPTGEGGAIFDEQPRHKVEVPSFWMSATEVTNAQYRGFLESLPEGDTRRRTGPNSPDLDEAFKGDDQPVVMVTWDDAQAFCAWVGHGVTLPTEAQWEYACRAGNETVYSFGDDADQLGDYAWYGEDYDMGRTHPVGQKPANAFGLYDMHGNAWEWCADWYGEDYYATCDGGGTAVNPSGPASGANRVARGGSYINNARFCRSATRSGDLLGAQDEVLGFRVVVPVTP